MKARGLARAQAICAALFVATFMGASVWARFDVPYRDDWDWLLFHFTEPSGWRALLTRHNEHVIPIARLLARLQFGLEGVSGHLIQWTALAAHVGTSALIWLEIRRRWPARPLARRFVGSLALVILFLTYQLQSVVFGAAVLFPLVQLFMVAALVALLNASDPHAPHRRAWGIATGLALVGAAASTTNGLLAPAVLGWVLFVRGGSRRLAYLLGGVSLMAVAVYLVFVAGPARAGGSEQIPAWRLAAIGQMLQHLATFFAGWISHASVIAGVLAGAALGVSGVVACLTLWRRAPVGRFEAFAGGLLLFGFVTGALIALGRAQMGTLQGAQSRYATFALVYIAALVILGASQLDARGVNAAVCRRLALAAVAASLAMLPLQLYFALLWKAKADNISAAYLALQADVPDDEWIATLHPMPEAVHRAVAQAGARGRGVVDRLMQTSPAWPDTLRQCRADLSMSRQAGGVLRLTGTADEPAAHAAIVDGRGVVVGLARPAPWVDVPQPSVQTVAATVNRRLASRGFAASGWLGFARAGGGAPFAWVAIDAGGAATCRGPVAIVPTIRVHLDAPVGSVRGVVVGGGWALVCDADLGRLELLVDDVPVVVEITSGVPRPDVRAAFASLCVPAREPGFQFQIDSTAWPAGPHRASVRMTLAGGGFATSNVVSFLIRR